jgi:hypothetical protein
MRWTGLLAHIEGRLVLAGTHFHAHGLQWGNWQRTTDHARQLFFVCLQVLTTLYCLEALGKQQVNSSSSIVVSTEACGGV